MLISDSKSLLKEIESSGINRIITDSRAAAVDGHTLFAALRTDLNDGHRYIPELYSRGVRVFLVNRDAGCAKFRQSCPEAQFLEVEDVMTALGDLAAFLNRDGFNVVVTGSTLKTEVKESLYRGLRQAGVRVFHSPRSFNSYLGVCLSVFENYFAGGSDVQIFEVGIDGPGQAAALRGILDPKVGVITDITDEHDENFPSHEAKVAEKEALIKGADRVETAFPGIVFPPIAPGSLRTRIVEGVRDNTLILDGFTPDAFSLRSALERFVRHSSPGRALVVALGEVDDLDESVLKECPISAVLDFSGASDPGMAEDEARAIRGSDVLVFGRRTPPLERFVASLEQADHDTSLIVDLESLVHNFNQFRRMLPKGAGLVCMVKASGYGVGAIEAAKALQEAGAAYLAVAVVDEGVQMRAAGITMPIMVMNPITRHYDALFRNRLEPAVFSPEELGRLIAEARRFGITNYPVHIKIDTGMHRVGFAPDSMDELAALLKDCDQVQVESMFSHLATADCLDRDDNTIAQMKAFEQADVHLRNLLGYGFRRHLLNTAGIMRWEDLALASSRNDGGLKGYEMARLGIGLYGISPLGERDRRLRPVATLRTSVISVKHYPGGTCIGYGCRGVTAAPATIATLAIGYADGIDRRLGNGAASFLINGVECPTIGNICMDMCMVDATAAPDVTVGTQVEIFGPSMPVERLAATLGTIPYEILTSVGPRVHRCYLK